MSNNPLSKTFSSSIHRNDDFLAKKWSHSPEELRHGDSKNRGDIDFTGDPGKTDPSYAKDADINNIVATYHKTGVFPSPEAQAIFADISDAPTYQEALQITINAENAFMSLDAKTRKRFDNDPAQLLSFLENPENRQEAIALGMIPEPVPTPSPAAPEPVAPPSSSSNKKQKPASTPAGDET